MCANQKPRMASPVEDGALVGNRVHEHHNGTVGERRLVAAVSPEAVCTAGDTKATYGPEQECPPQRGDLAVRHEKDAGKAEQLRQGDVGRHHHPDILQRRWEGGRHALLILVRDGGLALWCGVADRRSGNGPEHTLLLDSGRFESHKTKARGFPHGDSTCAR
eukprot:scaffold10478_cov114-Isochrysis_galbana.AAC.6